jgi:hypothetical protein
LLALALRRAPADYAGCLFWLADLGLLDLLQLQDKLPGLLLYHVALGGYNGDTLLKTGSVPTILSSATSQNYSLNFSIDPLNNQRVRASPASLVWSKS